MFFNGEVDGPKFRGPRTEKGPNIFRSMHRFLTLTVFADQQGTEYFSVQPPVPVYPRVQPPALRRVCLEPSMSTKNPRWLPRAPPMATKTPGCYRSPRWPPRAPPMATTGVRSAKNMHESLEQVSPGRGSSQIFKTKHALVCKRCFWARTQDESLCPNAVSYNTL